VLKVLPWLQMRWFRCSVVISTYEILSFFFSNITIAFSKIGFGELKGTFQTKLHLSTLLLYTEMKCSKCYHGCRCVGFDAVLSFRQMRDRGFCFCNMEIAFSLILAHLALLSTYMLYTNWLLVPGVAMRYVGNC
jgi:hypothetical protein